MQISVVSLFPEMVSKVAEFGVVGRARERGMLELKLENPRDFTDDVHRTVDQVDEGAPGHGPAGIAGKVSLPVARGTSSRALSPRLDRTGRGRVS